MERIAAIYGLSTPREAGRAPYGTFCEITLSQWLRVGLLIDESKPLDDGPCGQDRTRCKNGIGSDPTTIPNDGAELHGTRFDQCTLVEDPNGGGRKLIAMVGKDGASLKIHVFPEDAVPDQVEMS